MLRKGEEISVLQDYTDMKVNRRNRLGKGSASAPPQSALKQSPSTQAKGEKEGLHPTSLLEQGSRRNIPILVGAGGYGHPT